jgi:hypothetical protein
MKWWIAGALGLITAETMAATAYVSDQLILGVYTDQNSTGARLATLHSGAMVESLSVSGEFTQVRMADGVTGWVKTSYLTNQLPAVVRVKQLEDELARKQATAPALAEAAEHSEVVRLKAELAARQAELDSLHTTQTLTPSAPAPRSWLSAGAAVGTGIAGFALGYATLARRIRRKFGGLKVY